MQAATGTPAVIRTMLKAYPEAAREKNNTGYLPLHFAAMFCRHHNAAVISELLKAYPDAVLEESEICSCHCILLQDCKSDAAVISELLKAYPEAAREKTISRWTFAVASGCKEQLPARRSSQNC